MHVFTARWGVCALALMTGFVTAAPPVDVEQALRSGAEVITVPGSSTTLVLWNEGGEAHYGISQDGVGFDRVTATSYDVLLRYSVFDPLVAQPIVPEGLQADEMEAVGEAVYIVQFHTQPLDEFRSALEEIGASIHAYLARHSYLARMTAEQVEAVETLSFVRWVGEYHPAYKLEEGILAALSDDAFELGAITVNVQVFEKGPAQKAVVAARIEAIGGTVDHQIPDGYLLRAAIDGEQIRDIARMTEVAWIDAWGPPDHDMDIVRNIGGADDLEQIAGYTGAGVRGEVMDTNLDLSHDDFQANPPLIHGPTAGDASHGTATYGINFGDGTGLAQARGLVPDAQGIFADYGQLSNRYTHTAQLNIAPWFAVYQSNSWGSPQTTQYTSASMEMDDILLDHDVLILNSQSNTGTQDSRPQAWAKNIVSVGGIRHFGTKSLADDCWCGAASIGPAADGRVKPDLSFFNDGILTTTDDNSYTSFGGTSASTPEVAGYFGLFFQMWSDGVFGNPVDPNGTVFENRPHMTTSKAMMINTARPYFFDAPADDLRRFTQGWGLPDVKAMYDRRERFIYIIDETDVLQNLESTSYTLPIEIFAGPLRATLVYADVPGTTSSNLHRINDLTLKATSPAGEVYWGNNGMLSGNWTTPGGDPNDLDTVENIWIENPESGNWTIEVIASEINQDSHLETGTVDADYALVVSVDPSGNDECLNAPLLGDGSYFISTVNASSSGPDESGEGCGEFESDVWYRYAAFCEGTVTVSVCDADFDTQLAVYAPCPTGPGEFIACNDDFCGNGSQVTFDAPIGLYYVRIGGPPGVEGTATLMLSCEPGSACDEDLDDDGTVGINDLLELLAAWGTDPGGPPDFDGNGDVDVNDLLQMLAAWGACP